MKKNINGLKTALVALFCLAAAQVWAGADWPSAGKQYRIRNIYGAAYVTMNAGDAVTVRLDENELNTEYQLWEVEQTGSEYSFRNVGWASKGKDVYLACAAVASGAAVVGAEGKGDTGRFTLGEVSWNNWPCFNIMPVAAPSLSLNSNMAATIFTLASKNADGSQFLFEEGVVYPPEIVTLKNARSSKYIAESDGKLVQSATVTDQAKWIKYYMDGGYVFINNATHSYIQTPQRSQQVIMGKEPVVFYADTNGTYWAFGSGGMYLNETQTFVCGWNQGLNDQGSCWTVSQVGTITAEEVEEIMHGSSSYLKEVKDGDMFRIYCEVLDYYVFDNYQKDYIGGEAADESDMTHVWKAVAVGKESFYLQNIATGRYIKAGTKDSDIAKAVAENGTELEPVVNYAYSTIHNYFNFMVGNGLCLDMTGQGIVDNYVPGSKELSPAEWLLVRVKSVNQEAVDAARAEFEAYMKNSHEYEDMLAKQAETSALLAQLYTDAACTEFSDYAKAMSDDAFDKKVEALPALLRDMCTKMRHGTWPKTAGGRNLDEFFRIADYQVHSNAEWMHKVVGVTNEYSRLSNPTGISAYAGDIITVMVGDDCPAGARLKLEITDGGERSEVKIGELMDLNKGLNIFKMTQSADLFILYEINSTDDTPANYLSAYPDIRVHIEGGRTNGYFDLTRGMTDDEWADMVASGMLRHGRVFLKGDKVVGSWPTSILLDKNPTSIKAMAEFYNNIVGWDRELMGIDDAHMPGISKRFNNIYVANGTELAPGSYMYATSYGTYFNWNTLTDILSPSILTNGGLQWGPSHEFGHNHQELFNMVGCTEVSNNLFANLVVYKMGAAMSRGVALSQLMPNYASRNHWIEIGIWCKTQMYWKLYEFFHLAGRDPQFYQKVFAIMRRNPLKHENGCLVPASDDYLHFVEVCCEAADADLSEFFQMYGFFDELKTDTQFGGKACKKVDDYSTYYLYCTQDMIEATKARCAAYEKKYLNIGFIDDRIRQTPATYPGAPAGTMRSALNGGGANGVGSEGTLGMYLDYMEDNYTPAKGYTLATCVVGSTMQVSIVGGVGAMGFKLYDYDGELVYFANTPEFTVPAAVVSRHKLNKTNVRIVAADAFGNDSEVYNKDYVPSAIDAVRASDRNAGAIYDLSGRRLHKTSRGVNVVGGKKVVY